MNAIPQISRVPENDPKKEGSKYILGRAIFIIAFIIFFIIAFASVRYLTQKSTTAISGSDSKQEIVKQTILQVKSNVEFPQQLDAVTTWTGILEKPNAILYEYTLHDIDINQVNNEILKDYLAPSLCKNKDTKDILDNDILMEYSYKVTESTQSFFVSVDKGDCL